MQHQKQQKGSKTQRKCLVNRLKSREKESTTHVLSMVFQGKSETTICILLIGTNILVMFRTDMKIYPGLVCMNSETNNFSSVFLTLFSDVSVYSFTDEGEIQNIRRNCIIGYFICGSRRRQNSISHERRRQPKTKDVPWFDQKIGLFQRAEKDLSALPEELWGGYVQNP